MVYVTAVRPAGCVPRPSQSPFIAKGVCRYLRSVSFLLSSVALSLRATSWRDSRRPEMLYFVVPVIGGGEDRRAAPLPKRPHVRV